LPNWLVKIDDEDGDGQFGGNISPLARAHRRSQSALKAERESVRARRHGEIFFAYMRREDARSSLQRRWDWGDLPTWLILFGLTAIGLFIAICAYLLPMGRHMAPPTIKVY
jgi:hypothetical protein